MTINNRPEVVTAFNIDGLKDNGGFYCGWNTELYETCFHAFDETQKIVEAPNNSHNYTIYTKNLSNQRAWEAAKLIGCIALLAASAFLTQVNLDGAEWVNYVGGVAAGYGVCRYIRRSYLLQKLDNLATIMYTKERPDPTKEPPRKYEGCFGKSFVPTM